MSGPLEEAARALAALLEEARRASDAALAPPLRSRTALERTALALGETARLTAGVEPAVKALLVALADQLAAQRDRGEALRARAEELSARRSSYEELLARYTALGRAAQEVHRLLSAFATTGQSLPTASLAEVDAGVARLVEGAAAAGQAARESDFDDLTVEAELLARDLRTARDRLRDAAERFTGAPLQ